MVHRLGLILSSIRARHHNYRLLDKNAAERKTPFASILQPARPPSLSTNTICSFDIFASKSLAHAEPLLDNKFGLSRLHASNTGSADCCTVELAKNKAMTSP
ncbi:hypothetical protein DKX38_006785 [Salix brachista]|uniref:Uncharacterized protein n=1 Tax=Salix brachista TaxID=2182728 RepID=A0A5N5N4A3_9ROSI|nr:hypothetical protein DKX38_006785 [Salix brachista]